MQHASPHPDRVGIVDRPGRISAGLSTYLDVLRLAASLTVFAHHASYDRFDGGWLKPLGGFGHEAVVVFFVLSGFVIAYTVTARERVASAFAISRLARLWSVALPAIVATLAMDAVGRGLSPAIYEGVPGTSTHWFASTFFFNEFWSSHLQVGSNLPFWSLSYEAVYYAMFGLFVFAPWRWLWLAIVALLAGPAILLLGPAWVLGVLAFRQSQRVRSSRANVAMAVVGAAVAIGLAVTKVGNLYVTWRWSHWLGPGIGEVMGQADAFVSDNAIALAIAVHLIGVAGLVDRVTVAPRVRRWVANASLCTFPIYLFHYPALHFFTAIDDAIGSRNGVFVGLCSLAVGIVATMPCERLRTRLRAALHRAFGLMAGQRVGT